MMPGMRRKKKLHVFLKYYRLNSDVLHIAYIIGKTHM